MTAPRACLTAALDYAGRGWRVVPITPTKKHPLIRRWTEKASTEPRTITNWWRRWPAAGVGIATGRASGLFVLDVDLPEGDLSLAALSVGDITPPHTPISATGGGGQHLLFAWPEPCNVGTSAGKLGKGLDVRGDGGCIVAPPTIHESGRAYRWLIGPEVPLADAPRWLLAALSTARAPRTADPRLRSVGDAIPLKMRNSELTSIGGELRAAGWSHRDIERRLLEVNHRRCEPPLPDREVLGVARSVAQYPVGDKPFRYRWLDLVRSESGPRCGVRHILDELSRFMDLDGGHCFPSQETLAVTSGRSERNVNELLSEAEDKGWIRTFKHRGRGRAWAQQSYIATIPEHLKFLLDHKSDGPELCAVSLSESSD